MKRPWRIGVALAVSVLCGCAPNGGTPSAGGDSTAAAERFQLEREVGTRLEETRTRLDSLRAEVSQTGAKIDDAMATRLAALETQKETAVRRLAQLKQAGEQEWMEMRPEFATLLDSLDVRIDRLRQDLRRTR